MTLKSFNIPTAAAVVVLLIGVLTGSVIAADSPDKTANAAIVNGTAISTAELDDAVDYLQKRRRQPSAEGEEAAAELRDKALKMLIDRELLYQASKQRNIMADPAEVDKRMQALSRRYADQEAFAAALAQVKLTVEKIRLRIEQALAIDQLIDAEIAPQLTVSEEKVRSFYDTYKAKFETPEQVQARHILIMVAEDADEATRKKARERIAEVRQKIDAGGDFAALAKEFSEGPSATKGGDLGYFPRGKMVPAFDKAAFALKVGEISQPVETRFGYHIIEVTDHRDAGVMPFESVRADIETHLKQQMTPPLVERFVEQLRQKADIQQF